MPVGVSDLKQWAVLPPGWDAARLAQLELREGITYEQVVNDIAAALAMANAALLTDPILSGLISVTSDPTVEYRVGVSNGFKPHTEYSKGDPGRGKLTGHMLPLWKFDRLLGWTWDFLRWARQKQLDGNIASAFEDLRNIWMQKNLERLFKMERESVGSSGYSYPFADGGTADSTYIPEHKPDRADAFSASHDHYLRLDGINQANLTTGVKHLWEHGHNPPFDLLVSQLDVGDWTNATNVDGYVPRPDPLLRYGTQADLANVGDDYLGAVETDYGAVRLRSNGRIPTNYWALYKTYGQRDQRNPLRVYDGGMGALGAQLIAGEGIRQYPLEHAMLFFEFGIGVGEDRTAAVLALNAVAGDYVTPAIS